MRPIHELWALDEVLDNLAEQIQSLEEKRTAFASVLRRIRLELDLRSNIPLAQDYLIDRCLATPVESTELGGLRVCGIDGGLLKKSLRGFDLVITRASSTIFEYAPSGRVLAEYYPQQKTTPIVKADFSPKSWYEAEVNASLERIRTELELALKIIDQHPIDLLLLDGTLTPHISDRPTAHSPLSTKYHEIQTLHSQLFEQTKEKAILLAGIVKDSRSNRFVKMLGELLPHLIKKYPELNPLLQMDYRFVMNRSYDTDLLFRILDVGERSAIFRFKNPGAKSITQNINTPVMEREKIVGFYLRTAKYDYPLRVEVYTGDYNPITTVNKVSAMLVPMSSDNEELALPAVLIDVDSQARLFKRDLDFMFHQLAQRIGFPSNLLKLRRERMPFH